VVIYRKKPSEFDSPIDYCFKKCAAICNLCNTSVVVRCAWCKIFMYDPFFYELSYLQNFSRTCLKRWEAKELTIYIW